MLGKAIPQADSSQIVSKNIMMHLSDYLEINY